jgi:hypothetical protein
MTKSTNAATEAFRLGLSVDEYQKLILQKPGRTAFSKSADAADGHRRAPPQTD